MNCSTYLDIELKIYISIKIHKIYHDKYNGVLITVCLLLVFNTHSGSDATLSL